MAFADSRLVMIAASPYVRTVISLRSNASYFRSPVRCFASQSSFVRMNPRGPMPRKSEARTSPRTTTSPSNSALRRFSPSFAKSSSTNVVAFVIDSASILSLERERTFMPRADARLRMWVSLKRHPVLDRENWTDLHHGGTTGHVEYDSGDPARFVGGEEESRAGNVLGYSESSDRVCIDQHLSLCFGDACLVAVRKNRFGGDAIYADPKGTDLGRQVLRENLDPGLRRSIRDRRPGMGPAAGR